MVHADRLAAIAHEMRHAQDAGHQLAPFSSREQGFGLDDGYAVAALVHASRLRDGAVPAGRKIGFTNPRMWAQYGVRQPVWGHVYDHGVVRLGDSGDAIFQLAGLAEPRIEPEVVLHLSRTPPADAINEPAALLECIDWIAHGFEIVQSHFPGWRFAAADTVADQGLHASLLVGAPQPVESLGVDVAERLERFDLALFRNGLHQEAGTGANALGSPLRALAHLIGLLREQHDAPPLRAGELVTTGTLTAALPVSPGECWHTEIDGIGLPGLRVSFADSHTS